MAFFENLPNETTPLSADNLSRSESYLPATAGLLGKFYITIDGASGLADGDTLKITFPAATDGTENAEFSIDGGTTYKSIKNDSGDVISGACIEETIGVLKYDGTDWIRIDNHTWKTVAIGIGASGADAVTKNELIGATEAQMYWSDGAGRRINLPVLREMNSGQSYTQTYAVASGNITIAAACNLTTGVVSTFSANTHALTSITFK